MKQNKGKIWLLVLGLGLLLAMLPVAAWAEATPPTGEVKTYGSWNDFKTALDNQQVKPNDTVKLMFDNSDATGNEFSTDYDLSEVDLIMDIQGTDNALVTTSPVRSVTLAATNTARFRAQADVESLTVNGGSAILAAGVGSLTVNGGSAILAAGVGSLTVNGGSASLAAGVESLTVNGGSASLAADVRSLTVNGGTVTLNPENGNIMVGNITMEGGAIDLSKSAADKVLITGDFLYRGGTLEGNLHLDTGGRLINRSGGDLQVQFGGGGLGTISNNTILLFDNLSYYSIIDKESLLEALTGDGQVFNVEENVTLDSAVTVKIDEEGVTEKTLQINAGKTLTISGDGVIDLEDKSLTITGGNVVCSPNTYGLTGTKGTLTLEDVTVTLNKPEGKSLGGIYVKDVIVGGVNEEGKVGKTKLILDAPNAHSLVYVPPGGSLQVREGGSIDVLKFNDIGIDVMGDFGIKNGGTVTIQSENPNNQGILVRNDAKLVLDNGGLTGGKNGNLHLVKGAIVKGGSGLFIDRGETLNENGEITVDYFKNPASTTVLTEGNYLWNDSKKAFVRYGDGSVIVTPNQNVEVKKGETLQFTAQGTDTATAPFTGVTWSVSGSVNSGTKIDTNGLLTVAADETASTITVRARSKALIDKYCDVTVKIPQDGGSGGGSGGNSGGSSGGGSSYTYYTVKASAGTGGSISPNGNVSVRKGLDKTFTIKAADGYVIDDVLVDEQSVGAVSSYTIKNIAKAHTIKAVFEKKDTTGEVEKNLPFTDVAKADWFYNAVDYVYQQGLMLGETETLFLPQGNVTRAMLPMILYRQEGNPAVTGNNPFGDVAANAWYTEAVVWAAEKGLVEGYNAQTFAPNDPVTREQLAAMLYRYAQYKGKDVSNVEGMAIKEFTDYDKIGDWAMTAVRYCLNANIMKGKTEGVFDPQGNATRAELAQVLTNFLADNTKE